MGKPAPRPPARRHETQAAQVRSVRRHVSFTGAFGCCLALLASLYFGNRGGVDVYAWRGHIWRWYTREEPSGTKLSSAVQVPFCHSVCNNLCHDYPIAASTGFPARAFLHCFDGHASSQSAPPEEEARGLPAHSTADFVDALRRNLNSDQERRVHYKHLKLVRGDPLLSHLFDIEASLQHQHDDVLRLRQGGVMFYSAGDPGVKQHNQERPDVVRNLIEWIRENGGMVNEHVTVESASSAREADSGEGGVVLRASGHIPKNSIVVGLPYFMLLTSQTALLQNPVLQYLFRKFYSEEWIHSEHMQLILALTFDRTFQGLDFTPFYKTLPAHLESLPLLWPEVMDIAIDDLRKESPSADISNIGRQTLQPQAGNGPDERGREKMRKSTEARLDLRLKDSMAEFEFVLRHMGHFKGTLIATQKQHRRIYTKIALALGEYYKDHLNAAGIPFSSLPEPVRERGLLYIVPSYRTFMSVIAYVDSRNFGDKMAPLLELCNHDGKNPNMGYGDATDAKLYMLRAQREVQAGEILTFDYGLESPFQYWMFHGFVPPEFRE